MPTRRTLAVTLAAALALGATACNGAEPGAEPTSWAQT